MKEIICVYIVIFFFFFVYLVEVINVYVVFFIEFNNEWIVDIGVIEYIMNFKYGWKGVYGWEVIYR